MISRQAASPTLPADTLWVQPDYHFSVVRAQTGWKALDCRTVGFSITRAFE